VGSRQNNGWQNGLGRAQEAWDRLRIELARECAANQAGSAAGGGSGSGAGQGGTASPTPVNPLAGVWRYEAVTNFTANGPQAAEQVRGSLAFDADGTFHQILYIGLYLNELKGPYEVEGSTVQRSSTWRQVEHETLEYHISGDLLTLKGPKYVHTLRRISR
jgi:hypothetical protein